MATAKSSRRGLKICCGATFLVLIILLIVPIILFFTVFKPKHPSVQIQPPTIKRMHFQLQPMLRLDLTLGLVITISNPNYGMFKYKDTTAPIKYHGSIVAEAPIPGGSIPSKGKYNITTSIDSDGDQLVSSSYFLQDVLTGSLNFTVETTLNGKVRLLKIFKVPAKGQAFCNISLFLAGYMESDCKTKVHI